MTVYSDYRVFNGSSWEPAAEAYRHDGTTWVKVFPTKPDAPTITDVQQVSETEKHVRVNIVWSDGSGERPKGYRFRWRRQHTQEWFSHLEIGNDGTHSAVADIENAGDGETWEFQVQAIGETGDSDWSATFTKLFKVTPPLEKPGEMYRLGVTQISENPITVRMDWDSPPKGGPVATYKVAYLIGRDPKDNEYVDTKSTNLSFDLELPPGAADKEYWFRVRASNAAGDGVRSNRTKFTPTVKPNPPGKPAVSLVVVAGYVSVKLTPTTGDTPFTQYDVRWAMSKDMLETTKNVRLNTEPNGDLFEPKSEDKDGLYPADGIVWVQGRVSNAAGAGPWSDPESIDLELPPPKPRPAKVTGVKVVQTEESPIVMRVTWEPAEGAMEYFVGEGIDRDPLDPSDPASHYDWHEQGNVTEALMTVPPQNSGRTLHYQVLGVRYDPETSERIDGEPSDVVEIVGVFPPPTGKLPAPKNIFVSVPTNPTWRILCDAVQDATAYQARIKQDVEWDQNWVTSPKTVDPFIEVKTNWINNNSKWLVDVTAFKGEEAGETAELHVTYTDAGVIVAPR